MSGCTITYTYLEVAGQGLGECRVGGLADSEPSYLHPPPYCVPPALHPMLSVSLHCRVQRTACLALALPCPAEHQLSPPSHPNCLVCSRPALHQDLPILLKYNICTYQTCYAMHTCAHLCTLVHTLPTMQSLHVCFILCMW